MFGCHRRIVIVNARKATIAPLIITGNFPRGGPGIFSHLVAPRLEKEGNASVVLTDDIPKDNYVSARWDHVHRENPSDLGVVNWECKIGPLREIQLEFVWTVTSTKFESIAGFQRL